MNLVASYNIALFMTRNSPVPVGEIHVLLEGRLRRVADEVSLVSRN